MNPLAVRHWPAPLPEAGRLPLVIRIDHPAGSSRDAARERIRIALRQAVAATLGLQVDRLAIASTPGNAPRLLLDGNMSAAGLSISHAENMSIAAFHAQAAIGLDFMQVEEFPDWRAVARDYLGAQALEQLDAAAPAQRALAFAKAWTAREAQLKCCGLALGEWHRLPAAGRCHALELPPGYAGTLAINDAMQD